MRIKYIITSTIIAFLFVLSSCKELSRNIYTAGEGKYFKLGERKEQYKSIEFADGKAIIVTDLEGERTIFYGFEKLYFTEKNL